MLIFELKFRQNFMTGQDFIYFILGSTKFCHFYYFLKLTSFLSLNCIQINKNNVFNVLYTTKDEEIMRSAIKPTKSSDAPVQPGAVASIILIIIYRKKF